MNFFGIDVLNIEERLLSHNVYSKKGWTIKYRPWILVYTETFQSKKAAMQREKQLKTAQGRAFVWQKVKEYLGEQNN